MRPLNLEMAARAQAITIYNLICQYSLDVMSTHSASKFERTILETIEKNLHQLILEISKLPDMLAHRLNDDIDPNMFEKTIRRSVDNCRRLMGNLELLPNPSDGISSRPRQLQKDEIVTKSLHTERDETVLRVIAITGEKGGIEEIERLLVNDRLEDGIEMLLEKMLRFLAEMPVDRYHDYRDFRHKGLRGYLINRFLREKWRRARERWSRDD